MSSDLYIGEKAEKFADEQGLLTPLDLFLYFKMYDEIFRKNPSASFQEIYETIFSDFYVPRKKVLLALFHLESKRLILINPVRSSHDPFKIYIILCQQTIFRMDLPYDSNQIPSDDLHKLMEEKITEARHRIIERMNIEKIVEEIKDIKKELIAIFGIFVAIFSFIVISANTALSIEPTGPFVIVIILIFIIASGLIVLLLWLLKIWFVR